MKDLFPARHALVCIAFAPILSAAPAFAQQTTQAPPDCSAKEHRQFDFWVGEWTVTDSTGQRELGRNRITSILNDCVLLEEWTGAAGSSGRSHNIYSRNDGKWHQSWVDDRGNLLLLTGGLRNGAMVLEGETLRPDGARVLQRITWSIVDGDPNHVRQLWQQSTDGGTTWTVAFNGHYRKRE